ncbi:MAG: alpha/beta fold hydrolase [Gemmatimonas sp.]
MSTVINAPSRMLDIRGRKVNVLETGSGAPLLYLHGFVDVHGLKTDFMPFHRRLAKSARVVAPAHPGCNESDENPDILAIEDVVFHYLEVLDALDLKRVDVVGHSLGGWIAAELAARHPEKVARLVLIDAMGLFVPGQPTGDIFMMAQPSDWGSNEGLRDLLFRNAKDPIATEFIPDGRGDLDEEVRRYQMLRLGSWVGFKPPYFYNRALTNRVYRIGCPSLVVWGEKDRMVPIAHGKEYAKLLPGCMGLKTVKDAGHSTVAEQPDATAEFVTEFLA